MGDNHYSICGVILYEKPIVTGMLGQYVAVAKSSNVWMVYDDRQKKSSAFSPDKEVFISSILYIKLVN